MDTACSSWGICTKHRADCPGARKSHDARRTKNKKVNVKFKRVARNKAHVHTANYHTTKTKRKARRKQESHDVAPCKKQRVISQREGIV